ncbi:MAG: hypothetical protein UT01_C0062G0003 [Candidatus Daviesbacteria bacterium GW2011_GWA1_38_7]|nr:MAG: hypothetical protein UT01_C0062G0003 [Candidatus Daviesbacteria bacterium GW2011_GWA1_38_7]
MRKIKNKRGDIPITILVLGVVAICILAILSFYLSAQKVKSGFDIEPVKEAKLIKDKIIFYQNFGHSNTEINDILGITETDSEKYYYASQGSISVRYDLPR